MATDRLINDDEFKQLVDVLSNPDMKGRLSLNQLKQTQLLIQDYSENRKARHTRLEGEGFDDAQIQKINEAFSAAPAPNTGRTGAAPLGGGATPLQAAGLAEGAKQAVEGVFDLAKDVAVGLNLESEESRVKWKAGVTQRRLKSRIQQIETFGQMSGQGTELVGEIAPWLFASAGEGANLAYLFSRRVVQGAAVGGSTFQQEGDTFVDRALGLTLGATIGGATTALAIPSAAKVAVSRSFVKAFNDGTTSQRVAVEQLTREMTKNPEFALSMAQLTGSRFLFGLELQSASQATKAAQNKNMAILAKNLLRMAQTARKGAKPQSAQQVVAGLRKSLKDVRSQIYSTASKEFDSGANTILQNFGDDVVFRGKDFLKKIDDMIDETANGLRNPGGKPSERLIEYRNLVDTKVNPMKAGQRPGLKDPNNPNQQVPDDIFLLDRRTGVELKFPGNMNQAQKKALEMNEAFGGPTSVETIDMLAGLNNLIGGKAIIFEEVSVGSNRATGRALMGSFATEMESKPQNKFAQQAIDDLRQGYKQRMAQVEAYDNSVLGAVFGGKKPPKDPEKALERLMKSEKQDLTFVREFLEGSESGQLLLGQLRATHLRRIVSEAFKADQPAIDTGVALGKLSKRLSAGGGRAGKGGAGLFDAKTQADLVLTGKALQALKTKYFTGIVPGGIRIDEIAINAISRSSEFMARFLARAFSGGASMEKALIDPAVRKAIQAVAERGPTSPMGRHAMVVLATFIRQQDEQQSVDAAIQRRKEALKAQENVPVRAQTAQ